MSGTLTREQIDEVIDALTMGDVQAAFAASPDNDKLIAGHAFGRAAKRLKLVNGGDPLDSVSLADVGYIGKRVNEAVGQSNPLSESTPDSPDSVIFGE